MAGISNEEITEIRKKADIVEVIGSYINLAPQGKNYFGICPFHNDHSPSLSVSREKQIYKCFTCLASGNVFTFVQNYENISFIEAVKKVADKINYKLDIKDKIVNKNSKYYELMDLSNKIFVNNLNSNLGLKAKEYLINERHLSEEAIKEFNIGLALNDNNLNKLLSSKGYSDKDIIEMSLANKTDNGLLDMFRNRITFPICNHEGKIIAYSARIYQNEDTSKYINSKESVIFKKGYTFYNYDKCRLEALKIKSVILVEGQMDAIRVYTSGFKNVIASMGTAITSNHISLLKKLNAKVILMMDNDNAGEKSTILNGEELIKNNIEVSVVRLTGEKDPDSFILKNGADAFRDALKGEISFFDFKLRYLKKDKNLNKADELAEYINKIIDELNKSDDDILKSVTINKIAEDYNIDKRILEGKLVKITPRIDSVVVKRKRPKLNQYHQAAEAILYLMMNDPKFIRKYKIELNYFPEEKYKLIANDILAYKEINGEFDIADFMTYINDLEYKEDIYRILNDYQDKILPEEFDNFVAIINKWIRESKIDKLKEQLKNETDVKKQEELNDLIIKIKKGSED
ncbi:MAG: DNA primase [Bacilli bacterium]|nr:DNA primase [Bacilli bacterium]MCI6931610.1 DNA primase [Mycoplasmatota bacterium]